MIHISSPPQASHSPIEADFNTENLSEKSQNGESVKEGAQSKNKLGIFAKLLEGLISKGKKDENLGAEISETNLELANELSAKQGKNPLEGGEFALKANLEAKIVNIEELSANDLAFLKKGPGENEIGLLKTREISAGENSKEIFPRENLPKENLPREGLVKDQALNASSGELKGREDLEAAAVKEEGPPEKPELMTGEKAKNTGREAANFLSFSFREMEEQRQQPLESNRAEAGIRENSLVQDIRDRKNRPMIEVRDLRTLRAQEAADLSRAQVFSGQGTVDGPGSEGRGTLVSIDLDLSLGKGGGEPLSNALGKGSAEAAQSSFFEDALARELRGNLSADIVRNAMIIVRDGNEGTIRLSLRPASLGDVKIRLEMVDNKITGFIILESNEALRAFERELPVLEKAFRDSGFSETSLSLSLSQEGWSSGAQEEQLRGDFEALSRAFAASRYEAENEGPQALPNAGVDASGEVLHTPPGRTPVNLLV